jgi:hypothetical protein
MDLSPPAGSEAPAPPALPFYFSPDSLAFPIMTGGPLRARPRFPRRETFPFYCSLRSREKRFRRTVALRGLTPV